MLEDVKINSCIEFVLIIHFLPANLFQLLINQAESTELQPLENKCPSTYLNLPMCSGSFILMKIYCLWWNETETQWPFQMEWFTIPYRVKIHMKVQKVKPLSCIFSDSCNPMNCSHSCSIHLIFQVKSTDGWLHPSPGLFPWPSDWTCGSCDGGRRLPSEGWATNGCSVR